jgi:sterol 3beta-glucosyltransferase
MAEDLSKITTPPAMHITLMTIGTRGDVQPYIAFGKGLMRDGHKVRIATHLEYKNWIEGFGIEFKEVKGDPAEIMKLCVDNGMFTYSFIKEAYANFGGWLEELFQSCAAACEVSRI